VSEGNEDPDLSELLTLYCKLLTAHCKLFSPLPLLFQKKAVFLILLNNVLKIAVFVGADDIKKHC